MLVTTIMIRGYYYKAIGTVHRAGPPPEQMLIGGVVVRTVPTVHPGNPLESFLFGFSSSGEGSVTLYHLD